MTRTMTNHRLVRIGILMMTALALLVAGCASVSTQEKERAMSAVERARVGLEKAKADPNVASASAVPLYEAEQILRQAEQADDIAVKEHLAYMADRKTQLAVLSAERNMAEEDTLKLGKEKDQLLLKVKEREAMKARADVKMTQAELDRARMESEKKTAELSKAKEELEALKAKPTDRGMVLTLGDVLFQTNRATLSPGAVRTIDQLASFMNKYPERNIVIEGHTDSRGESEYNLTLSQRRADSVKMALVEKGIAASRITTAGYGETYPMANNETAAGRQQNRRVEVVILEDGASPE